MSPEHLLVVVADDGGVDAARNGGILAALERGAVTCTSLLANGAAFGEIAAALRRTPSAGVGLHLNLTEGRALAGDVPGLTTGGRFLGDKREVWRRALAGHVHPDDVRREALAQIERIESAGLVPTHADGHQHVHLLPGVREGLAAALDERPGIGWVRLPRPVWVGDSRTSVGGPTLPDERLAPAWRAAALAGRRTAAALGTLADQADVLLGMRRSADAFIGVDLVSSFSLDALLARLRVATETLEPPGPWVVEVMTHPGDCDSASTPFSASPARAVEVAALCDPELPTRVAELGFRLGRFADAVA